MRQNTVALASAFLVASVAASAGAVLPPNQFTGSDSLFYATNQAIGGAALPYVGGGTVLGQTCVVAGTQGTAPMSRMFNTGAGLCTHPTTGAEGLVVGLEAAAIVGPTASAGNPACGGLVSTNVALGFQTWRDVLALLYGGQDNSTCPPTIDCGSAKRAQLVANWNNLFQSSCPNSSVCTGAPQNGALWHAYRRDDALGSELSWPNPDGSGGADLFAQLVGLSTVPSATANNGFGRSPYCNALNWDTQTANANCALGAHEQWTSPGGVVDPLSKCTTAGVCGAAGTGNHRRPPPGAWGDNPDSSQGALGADVLPTGMQDNDPIRRPCIGGATNVSPRSGEEVCNIDGKLGLVLPIPATDFIPTENPGLVAFPTNPCNAFDFGLPPNVFTCAIRGAGTKHFGECPNGDALYAGECMVPIDVTNNTSQCVATKATVAALQSRTLGSPDGRIYNLHMHAGPLTGGPIKYMEQHFPNPTCTAGSQLALDFAGDFSRIHEVEVLGPPPHVPCTFTEATDQIGCLVQADPCSIGFAGPAATAWTTAPSGTSAIAVNGVVPAAGTVQAYGTPGGYPIVRKMYLNTLVGFSQLPAPDTNELMLAQFEATAGFGPILSANGFFPLGPSSPTGANLAFCEDFNEQTICGAGVNVNACATNPSGIPTVSTICGNGVIEAFEECDDGNLNGKPGVPCSVDCRVLTCPPP